MVLYQFFSLFPDFGLRFVNFLTLYVKFPFKMTVPSSSTQIADIVTPFIGYLTTRINGRFGFFFLFVTLEHPIQIWIGSLSNPSASIIYLFSHAHPGPL